VEHNTVYLLNQLKPRQSHGLLFERKRKNNEVKNNTKTKYTTIIGFEAHNSIKMRMQGKK